MVSFQVDYARVLQGAYAVSALKLGDGGASLRTTADAAALTRVAQDAMAELAMKLGCFVESVDPELGALVLRDIGAEAVTLHAIERTIQAAVEGDAAHFADLAADLLATLRRRFRPAAKCCHSGEW
jgi:hypothetical protein